MNAPEDNAKRYARWGNARLAAALVMFGLAGLSAEESASAMRGIVMASERTTIQCAHGTLTAAVVCRHHIVAQERVTGFIENSSDPNDLQAWCDDCETFFEREGELTEEFRRFNDFAVVCVICYSELKTKHARV